ALIVPLGGGDVVHVNLLAQSASTSASVICSPAAARASTIASRRTACGLFGNLLDRIGSAAIQARCCSALCRGHRFWISHRDSTTASASCHCWRLYARRR